MGSFTSSLQSLAAKLTPRRSNGTPPRIESWNNDGEGGEEEHADDLEAGRSSWSDGELSDGDDDNMPEQLDFDEFCARFGNHLVDGKSDQSRDEQLQTRFGALDARGKGKVDLHAVMSFVLRDAMQKSSSRVIDLLKSWDEDGSGSIDKVEFRAGIQKMGFEFPLNDEVVDMVFDHYDDEKNGSIEFKIFHKQLRIGADSKLSPLFQPGAVSLGPKGNIHKLRRKSRDFKGSKMVTGKNIDLTSGRTVVQQLRDILAANAARVIDLFHEWDDDGSGTIDKKEFRQALKAMGVDADQEDINALFDTFDADGGGTIEFSELNNVLKGDTLDTDLDQRLKAGAINNQAIRAIRRSRDLDDSTHGASLFGSLVTGRKTNGSSFAGRKKKARSSRAGSKAGGSVKGSTRGSTTRSGGGSSQSGDPSSSGYDRDRGKATTMREVVARDAKLSPSWRLYHLNKQVYHIMVTKDRSMPMAPHIRSPRHTSDQSRRLIPPARPKPRTTAKMSRRQTAANLTVMHEERQLSMVERLQLFYRGICDMISSAWNGFLEQDLEVQMVLMFVVISAGVKVWQITTTFVRESQFEPGHAPPAPPVMPDWTITVSDSAMGVALEYPITYLLVDFGSATILGLIVLFWEDMREWKKAHDMKAKGYQSLGSGSNVGWGGLRNAVKSASVVGAWKAAAQKGEDPSAHKQLSARSRAKELVDENEEPVKEAAPLESEDDLRRELAREIDKVEELEIRLKVHTTTNAVPEMIETLQERVDLHRERQSLLKEALKSRGADTSEKKEAEPDPLAIVPTRADEGICARIANSGILTVLKNSMNGFISVYIFFLDVASDIAVIYLLWNTGNIAWAIEALFFLVAQYVVVYFRVLPYMRNTFGEKSCLTISYSFLGFPMGVLILDFLMLLEPFGLLAVLPLPVWLKQFVPAYKATRVITEIAIESLPQCLLQAGILVVVMQASEQGTDDPSILAMVNDASTMPKSISISTLAILKTWVEVVQQSREAGISVKTKIQQLWHVGAGLPLDALKKGSIVEWSCGYKLDQAEIPPLIDALIKNTSLSRLNLMEADLEWDAAKGSAAPLVDALGKNPSGLSGLQILIVDKASEFEIPMGEMRKGPERAFEALKSLHFFRPGQRLGAWEIDIMVCGDVLRTNANKETVTEREQAVGEEVKQLLEDAQTGQLVREDWELRTKQLMAGGDLRRSHLRCLVSAEILRDIGFRAADLIGMNFSIVQLKNGRFTVSELREAQVPVSDMCAARYSSEELYQGGVLAEELRPLGYAPYVLREGGYTATEMRAGKYPLAELKEAYTAAELYEAEFPAAEMRKVGYKASELKNADWRPDLLRKGGYTARELRVGGYDASQANTAGYTATEATEAGWSLKELKHANFDAAGLRTAGHKAEKMREAGFQPIDMRKAQYPTVELVSAGYGAEDLRKAGIPLAELMNAGVTIADMRESGVTVMAAKNEGIKLRDMRIGGYTCKDVKAANYSCKEVKAAGFVKGLKAGGYTINEAVAARYTCQELHTGGYSAEELFAHGFTPLEMRAVGYDAKSLQDAGVTLPKLRAAGVAAGDLRSAGFTCEELLQVGVAAHELHAANEPCANLKAAGFELKTFHKLYSVDDLHACGYTCEELRAVGFSVKAVKSCGVTNKELRDGGYSASELREVGATCKELKVLQYKCAELKQCGFTAKELVAVGFDSYSLKMGGFRPRHVKECGFKGASVFGLDELKADGFRVTELRDDEGFDLMQLSRCFSVEELRVEGNVKAEELIEVGYPLIEMRKGGFSATDLFKAGFGVQDMKTAGYACKEVFEAGFVEGLKSAGYTCKEARDAGYTELKRAGFDVQDLKIAKCTLSEVKAAGFVKGIKEAGYSCLEARKARFPAKLLRAAGFSPREARDAGYGKDFKAAGFTVKEAREVGCSCEEVKEAGYVEGVAEAGYTIQEAFDAIFSCEQARRAGFVGGFKDVGYTVTEAKIAGFSPEGFRAAGYDVEEFKFAGYSCAEAKLAGYSIKEARIAGWKTSELEKAGYPVYAA